MLAISYWLLAIGCWLLAFGYWLLAVGCWLVAIGKWLFVTLTLQNEDFCNILLYLFAYVHEND